MKIVMMEIQFQVYPNASEICDGLDNMKICDGQIDEGTLMTIYEDIDGDGFGNPDASLDSCEVLNGFLQQVRTATIAMQVSIHQISRYAMTWTIIAMIWLMTKIQIWMYKRRMSIMSIWIMMDLEIRMKVHCFVYQEMVLLKMQMIATMT